MSIIITLPIHLIMNKTLYLILQYNLIMLRRAKPRRDLIGQIDFQITQDELQQDQHSPEVMAKNSLIQISDWQVDQPFLESQNYKENVGRRQSETFRVKDFKLAPQTPRISVANHFTQSHRIWRKKSNKLLEQQPPSPPKPENPKNQSKHGDMVGSFIIFENGYLNNFNSQQNTQIPFGKGFLRTTKAKPSRNIMALIKRKNIANLKQNAKVVQKQQESLFPKSKRSLSPTDRISKSCELGKEWEQISPMKITTSGKIEQSVELQCTSPNFRNKKISNYIKMRANRSSKGRLQ